MSVGADSRLRIVVSGLIAQHPGLAGVAWDYVQYVLGLAQLGHEVHYLEDSGQWPYSADGGPSGNDWIVRDCKTNVAHLDRVMRRWGLGERWSYRCPVENRWYGAPDARRRELLSTADLLLNVSGSLSRPLAYRRIPRLAYIDSDPVFTQVKLRLERGHKRFQRRAAVHDVFFSFGEQMGAVVPSTPYTWLPTRQPIVLSEWRPGTPSKGAFTTVMSWASYPPLRLQGVAYGQKDLEFRRFVELPDRVGAGVLEVAMGDTRHVGWESAAGAWPGRAGELLAAHPDWSPQQLLRACGWRVVDAARVGADLDSYRDYIESSAGEWSVAKGGYVAGDAGWFSCRSACYLAAGKPVVVQDTGFSRVLPVGEGLMAFVSPDDAAAAIDAVCQDYGRHALAARTIAEDCFDAARVLPPLIESAMNHQLASLPGRSLT